MLLTQKHVNSFELIQVTIPANAQYPARTGWKVDGYYLNGSDQFTTKADLVKGLVGHELSPAKSGKSLVIVGSFTAVPVITERLSQVLTARETVVLDITDLNSLL